jgi:hypothetical protein
MPTRTLRQLGRGHGSSPVSIVARIDNNVVYSGTVPTVNEPFPALPNDELSITDTLFSWENTVEFTGQQDLEISVTGGDLLLADTEANYVNVDDVAQWGGVYYVLDDQGNVTFSDPLEQEKIDGVLQPDLHTQQNLPGQWWWKINAGSVFTAKVNIIGGATERGRPYPPPTE